MENTMRLYTCTDHAGHWPVPRCSIVIANDADEARALLEAELAKEGLNTRPFTLKWVELDRPKAIVLCNGEY